MEYAGNDPFGDEDGDGTQNYSDTRRDIGTGDGSTTVYTDANGDGVPDAYDFDNDGIPNHIDLDADGDGIPDNIEAQSTAGYDAPNGDAGPTNDGVDSAYAGGLSPVNTDGTDGFDYLDTDADNDGTDDTSEAGITLNGSIGTNGLDSATDNPADDFSDPNGSYGNDQTANFPDSDGAGDVDYRDLTVPVINTLTTNDTTPTLTGTHDSDTVLSVTVNGTTYTEGDANLTDNGDGTWQLNVPTTLVDGTYEVTAVSTLGPLTKTDASNNELTIDATAPTITIDVVAVDDIINAAEDDSPVTISGTTTGAENGQPVTVVLNGTTYNTTTTDGIWSFDITALEAQALNANETITADVTDQVGNNAVQATRDIQHDVAPPTIAIDVVSTDDIINALEDDSPVTISGTTDAEDGQTVRVELNGNTYTTTVSSGAWSLDIPAVDAQALDATETITADVSDLAGNDAVQATRPIAHDTAPHP